MTSDFRPEVEIWPFCISAMHPAIYRNSSFIVTFAMGQVPRSTERISSIKILSSERLLFYGRYETAAVYILGVRITVTL